MFSSFFSSIPSPKLLLASKIAAKLAVYFEVDAAAIETNLVNDAKIVLRNIRLKPQSCVACGIDGELVGGVENIEFSWKWGGSQDGSTSFVRETLLSIRGAKFRLIAKPDLASNALQVSSQQDSTTNPMQEENTASPPGFMDHYVQQIIDHLTLNITDFEVSVESIDHEAGKLVVEAKSVQLLSLGRRTENGDTSSPNQPVPPLSQRLSVGSLCAYILKNETKKPLLDPFAYAASVKRVSGKRFQGLAYGLEVTSDMGDMTEENGNALVIHAGSMQVAVLSQIFTDFLDSKITTPRATAAQRNEPVEQQRPPKNSHVSTVFLLPFPSLVLCLPNGSKIQMPNCKFRYHMDGYSCCLEGTEGIHINEERLPLLQLSENVSWCIDFIGSSFAVRPNTQEDKKENSTTPSNKVHMDVQGATERPIAHFRWDENAMNLLVDGFLDLKRLSDSTVKKVLEAYDTDSAATDSPPWSVEVLGGVSALVCGHDGEWIKASIASPSLVLLSQSDKASGVPFSELEIAGLQLGPTSFGDGIAQVPAAIVEAGTNKLCLKAAVKARVENLSVLEKVKMFVSRVARFQVQRDSSLTAPMEEDGAQLPLSVEIPSFQVSVTEPKPIDVELDNIRIDCNNKVEVGSLVWDEKEGGICGSILGFSLTNREKVALKIKRIKSLRFPGLFDLTHPISDSTLTFSDGTLDIHMDVIHGSVTAPNRPKDDDRGLSPTHTSFAPTASLPCTVHAHVQEVSLLILSERQSTGPSMTLRSVDIEAAPRKDGIIDLQSRETISVEIRGSNGHQMDAQLGPSSTVLSTNYTMTDCSSLGLQIGPASFGNVAVTIPPFKTLSEFTQVRFKDSIVVDLDCYESVAVAQTLVTEFLQCTNTQYYDADGQVQEPTAQGAASNEAFTNIEVIVPRMEVSLAVPQVKIACTDIKLSGSTMVQIGSAAINAPDGMAACCRDISCEMCDFYLLKVGVVDSFDFPGRFSLSDSISGAKMKLTNGKLLVRLPMVGCIMESPNNPAMLDSTNTASSSSLILPFAVNLRMDKLVMFAKEDPQTRIFFFPIDVAAATAKDLTCFSINAINARIETSSEDWIEARFEKASAFVEPDAYKVTSLSCSSIHIGPCSYGNVALDIPLVSMDSETNTVTVEGVMRGEIQSAEHSTLIKELVQRQLRLFAGPSPSVSVAKPCTTAPTMTIVVPKADFHVQQLKAHVEVSDISLKSPVTIFRCSHVYVCFSDGTSMSMAGLEADTDPVICARVEAIESLYIPAVLSLREPVKNTKYSFCPERGLSTEIHSMSLVLLDGKSAADDSTSQSVSLPFSMRCSVAELDLETKQGSDDLSLLRGLIVELKPVDGINSLTGDASSKTGFSVTLPSMENKLGKICGVTASGKYCGANTISHLKVQVGSAVLLAGFSSVEWTGMFEKDEDDYKKTVWNLPFASVLPFKASVGYQGIVVSTEASLDLSFSGDAATTSDDITTYFTNEAIRQVPSFFSNAEVLGESVVDITAKSASRMVLSNSLKGSVAGSVGGIVAVDSIRGAIGSGKKARGASSNDRYQFGDLTRGSVRAIVETAKTGGSMRRENRDTYQVGDFTAGAKKSIGQYVGDNKSRLGAAGGSGLGMAAGAALLGPVGLVAGSLLGSAAGGKAFQDDTIEKDSATRESSQQHGAENEGDLLMLNQPTPYEGATTQQVQTGMTFTTSRMPYPINEQVTGTAVDTAVDPFAPSPQQAFHSQGTTRTADPFAPPTTSGQQKLGMQRGGDPITPALQLQSTSQQVNDPFGLMGQPASTIASAPPLHSNMSHRNQQSFLDSNLAYRSAANGNQQSYMDSNSAYRPSYNYGVQTGQVPNQPSHHQQQRQQLQQQRLSHQYPGNAAGSRAPQTEQQQQQQQGYRFGDVTRSIISKGKQKAGRSEKDGYQFGDFTRGLFKK